MPDSGQVDLNTDTEKNEPADRFDVYFSYTVENTEDGSQTTTIRQNFKNLLKADMKAKVIELIDSTPDDVEGYLLDVELSMNDQMDAALAQY